MGYVVEQKSQINSELGLMLPRLKSFASALTGSEALSQTLVKATRSHFLAKAKDRGHTPLALWAFMQMHTLWASRMKAPKGERGSHADPRLFCPRSRANDGSSGAVRFARMLAQLPPQQRGTLHLIYGERLSYDEVAEVFGVPVSTVMTRLARSYAALAQANEPDAHEQRQHPHHQQQHHAADSVPVPVRAEAGGHHQGQAA